MVLVVYYGGLSSGATGLVEAYNTIILLATFTTLVPYAFCAMAELLLYFQDSRGSAAGASEALARSRWLAFAFAFLTIVGSGAQTALYGFASLLLGVPVYVWMRKAEAEVAAARGRSAQPSLPVLPGRDFLGPDRWRSPRREECRYRLLYTGAGKARRLSGDGGSTPARRC